MHYYKKIQLKHSALNPHRRMKRAAKQLKRLVNFVRYKQRMFKQFTNYFGFRFEKETMLLRFITFFRILIFRIKNKYNSFFDKSGSELYNKLITQ